MAIPLPLQEALEDSITSRVHERINKEVPGTKQVKGPDRVVTGNARLSPARSCSASTGNIPVTGPWFVVGWIPLSAGFTNVRVGDLLDDPPNAHLATYLLTLVRISPINDLRTTDTRVLGTSQ